MREFQHISVNILQEFKHAKLVHGHYQGSFDLKVYFPDEAGENGLLRGWRDVGGHETEVRVFEISAAEGIERGTNVEKGVDG